MNLGDRVLRPASGPEPVRARLEVGLEDRLQRQLEGGLHDPVADRRNPQPRQLAAALGDRATWVEPQLVAQVGFSEWTRDGRLRHPRFLGLRDDKAADEVVRE